MIEKREGFMEELDSSKIESAIEKALKEAGHKDMVSSEEHEQFATEIARTVSRQVQLAIPEYKVTVEMIQDWVEDNLMEAGLKQTAKAFIKYRAIRTKKREAGWNMDGLQEAIWTKKYQQDDESFEDWLVRVSGGNPQIAKLIRDKKFIFAGRILAHRGIDKKVTYSNCYVMPRPEDNIEDIFDTAGRLAKTYSYGGGCGVDISNLRPKGAVVNNSARFTTGATSFVRLYNVTTDTIGQEGRRGALMISIADSHPDLEDFIEIKTKDDAITKANISIRVSNDFMNAVVEGLDWLLHWEGEDGQVIEKTVNAREVFRKNAENNWDWAEAGMLYWDAITNWHLMSEHPEHEFAGVNPCAEEPLMAGGSCLLGSINLSEFVALPFTDQAYFDTDKFIETVYVAVRGLNEVLDEGIDLHPLQIQRDNARDWRQIGLGVMGIADMFIKMGIPYGSEKSFRLSKQIGHIMLNSALMASSELAEEQGVFPKYDKESLMKSHFLMENVSPAVMGQVEEHGLRNSQILTIAPTGSISTMWGISGGIEPIFATHFERKTESLHGEDVVYKVYQPIVKEYMEATGIKALVKDIDVLVTAHDLHWKNRIKMQGVWQHFIDASISSTVNLPNEATVEDVEELFIEAWKHRLKGVTIFRDGSKRGGVLTVGSADKPKEEAVEEVQEQDDDSEGTVICQDCGAEIKIFSGGCSLCAECGWSPCG